MYIDIRMTTIKKMVNKTPSCKLNPQSTKTLFTKGIQTDTSCNVVIKRSVVLTD